MSYAQTYSLGYRGLSKSKNTIFSIFLAICTDFYYSHGRQVCRVIHFWKAHKKGFQKIYTCPRFWRTPWGTGGFKYRKMRFFRFFGLFARISTIRTDAKYAVLYIFEKRIKRAFRKYIHVLCSEVLPGVQGGLNFENTIFTDFFWLFARISTICTAASEKKIIQAKSSVQALSVKARSNRS